MFVLKTFSSGTLFSVQVGSSSFRLMYLPDGAHVVLVGGAEVAYPGMFIPPQAATITWNELRWWRKLTCALSYPVSAGSGNTHDATFNMQHFGICW